MQNHRIIIAIKPLGVGTHSVRPRRLSSLRTDGVRPSICLAPCVYHVVICRNGDNCILDRLWVVAYSEMTQALFTTWETSNVNTNWTSGLPRPYSHIKIDDNGQPIKPTSGTPALWKAPRAVHSFLHHNASFEMRSANPGQHGHQATYDENGDLITETIAAGTADFYNPLSFHGVKEMHRRNDVIPFLRSLTLDGNPSVQTSIGAPTQLDHPCLYQGSFIDTYIRLRPVTPSGIQQGDPP